MANGMMIGAFDFSTAQADEFHDWYDLEHLPERARIAGFGACERWIGVDAPTVAVATYDIDSIGRLTEPAYMSIAYENLSPWSKRMVRKCKLLLRYQGTQTVPGNGNAPAGAGALLLDVLNVSAEVESDFNNWFETEHLPAAEAVDGVMAARRFVSENEGEGLRRYVTLYHLAEPDVVRGAAWKATLDKRWKLHIKDHLEILGRRYVRQG